MILASGPETECILQVSSMGLGVFKPGKSGYGVLCILGAHA